MIRKIIYNLILLITVTSCGQEAEDTIRLIPDGYKGTVLIIFNQEDGEPKEYEDGKRLYRIPENGVLKTQFKPNYGTQKHQFFYVDNNNNRTEIPFIAISSKEDFNKFKDSLKVYAYLEKALGKIEKYDPKTKELLYTIQPARTFFVSNLKDPDKDFGEQLGFITKHRQK